MVRAQEEGRVLGSLWDLRRASSSPIDNDSNRDVIPRAPVGTALDATNADSSISHEAPRGAFLRMLACIAYQFASISH